MKASEDLDCRARRLFGGMGVYTGEKMFAILLDDDVSFRLSPADRKKALAMEGTRLFKRQTDGREMTEFVVMPGELLDDQDQFELWLKRSAKYSRSKMKFTN